MDCRLKIADCRLGTFFVVLCLLFVARASAAEVARVGNEVITAESVRQTVARNGYNIFDEASVKKGVEDAVQFELLAAEAKKIGLDQDPAVVKQIKELLVQRLLAEKVDKPLAGYRAAPEEVQAYFEAHTNQFRRAAMARGTIITLLINQGNEAEARSKAAMALQELKTSLKPEAVARAYSEDPSEKMNGGLSNFFVEGDPSRRYPQAVSDAMLGLKSRGEVAGPIASPRALYLVKLVERREAQPMPFEQVKAEIHKRLHRVRREKLLAEYCEGLKKEFPVTVNEAELKAAVERSKPGAGPPGGPGGMP